MIRTSNALINLWLNAALLPVAFVVDAMNAGRPTDSEQSGAPEGANVIELEARRRKMERG